MKRVWITKDKQHLKIKDMKTSHIKNCINMLHRYHAHKTAEAFSMANLVHGEQAELTIDAGLDDIMENGWEDLAEEYIATFEEELGKRGLNANS